MGLVRLSGPLSLVLLQAVCRRAHFSARHMYAVELRRPGSAATVDQALVCYMPAPRSYTGEDVAEVFVHGGPLLIEAVIELFVALGARRAEPGEFTRRAFLNGRLDLVQAEAVAQAIGARSERALSNAQALLAGGLSQRLAALRARVVALAAQLEAEIDFAEDLDAARGQAPPQEDTRLAEQQRLIEELGSLAASYRQGSRLDGISVALVGAVNAGKSSLFNQLLGTQRALVSAEPGTTRDYLEAEVSWQGVRVCLIDTAGLRPAAELSSLERAGRELAAPVVRRCDAWVEVIDISQGEPPEQAAERLTTRQVSIVAANKVDVVSPEDAACWRSLGVPVVLTSGLHGIGIDELKHAILAAALPAGGEQETVHVTSRRQCDLLGDAAMALERSQDALGRGLPPELVVEHVREALGALDAISGEVYTEEVLDSIFSRFCIGK